MEKQRNNKPDTDESLLERCVCREAAVREAGGKWPNGEPYIDLEHDLGISLAKRDYEISEKKIARRLVWFIWLHRAIQIGIAAYVFVSWDDLSLKMFLLLSGIFLWRSINRKFDEIRTLQGTLIELQTMAHPTAKEDFFKSEHCYKRFGRAWDLLRDKALNKRIDEKIAPWLAENGYTPRIPTS